MKGGGRGEGGQLTMRDLCSISMAGSVRERSFLAPFVVLESSKVRVERGTISVEERERKKRRTRRERWLVVIFLDFGGELFLFFGKRVF